MDFLELPVKVLYFEVLPTDIVRFLLEKNYLENTLHQLWNSIPGLCRNNQVSNFQRFPSDTSSDDSSNRDGTAFLNYCAAKGYTKLMSWALKNGGVVYDEKVCQLAAKNGHIEVLRWCNVNGFSWKPWVLEAAAEGGAFTLLQWARTKGAPWTWRTCARAARHGRMEILQWCKSNGAPWGDEACSMAALGGHLDVLKWCRANGATWDNRICHRAVVGGDLETVKWCTINGQPNWKLLVIECAAFEGNIEILKWCRENWPDAVSWDSVCYEASKGGHLEVLQWCRLNGDPWDEMTIAAALARDHKHIVEWCEANHAPYDEQVCKAELIISATSS